MSKKYLLIILGFVLFAAMFFHQQKRAINYSRLEKNLANKEWKQADIETAIIIDEILRKMVDEETFWGYSALFRGRRLTLISQFDCKQLKQIDDLWTKYSQGYYGFTRQSIIANNIVNSLPEELVRHRVEEHFYRHPSVDNKKELSNLSSMYRWEEENRRFSNIVKYNADPAKMDEIYSNAVNPKETPGLLPSHLWFYQNTRSNLIYSLNMITNYNKSCHSPSSPTPAVPTSKTLLDDNKIGG
jgi:GUN4-like/RTC4-like domain